LIAVLRLLAPAEPQDLASLFDRLGQLSDQFGSLAVTVNALLEKDKTIVLSSANEEVKTELLRRLHLQEIGAEWPNKPVGLTPVKGFGWRSSAEDSPENRQAYMAYLTDTITLPTTHGLMDAQAKRTLLTVNFGIDDITKIKGTTDVAIMANKNIDAKTFKNNIEILFELKKPPNLDGNKDHTPQAVGEHLAASCLNRKHPVVSVLTDLNNNWTFYWFAKRNGDDYEVALYKFCLEGNEAAMMAKHILDNLYDAPEGTSLPTTLSNRISFIDATEKKDSKLHLGTESDDDQNDDNDRDHSGGSSRNSKRSSQYTSDNNRDHSGGSSQNSKRSSQYTSDSNRDHSGGSSQNSKRSSQYTSDSNGQGSFSGRSNQDSEDSDYGSSSMGMAHALSLFAPPSFRDVANELDLLDMVDDNEKYEIVRAFAMQHIVPHIAGG
jgi:hypothetical protein